MIIDKCNACEYSMIQGKDLYFCNVKGKYITHCFDCYTYKLYNTLQEIKAIAERYENLKYPISSIIVTQEILRKITKAEEE